MKTNNYSVLISISEKEYNGKKYYNANLEDCEDGTVNSVGCDEEVVKELTEKYKQYHCWFDIGAGKNGLYMRLLQADLVK